MIYIYSYNCITVDDIVMLVKLIIASAREAPSACIYENRRQRIKSLKIVVETWDKNQFCYFYVVQNSFL